MNKENYLNKISLKIYILIPFFLITGPFLSDLGVVTICILFLYTNFLYKSFHFYNNLYFKVFIIFFFVCCLSSAISDYSAYSIKSSLSYLRFGIFSVAVAMLLNLSEKYVLYLTKIFLIILIVLFIDSLIQFFFGFNSLGWRYEDLNFRVTSFFGDDEVLGSYVARFFPFILSLILFSKKHLDFKINDLFIYAVIFSSVVICVISGERTSFLLLIISLTIILLTCPELKKIMIWSIIISTLSTFLVIFTNENIKKRMIDQTIRQMGLSKTSDRLVIFSETYEGHYKISINMIKEKPILGHGPKSFRKYCAEPENYVAQNACTTHPHNLFLQILAETGIMGFLIIFFVFLLISYKLIKILIFRIQRKKIFFEDYNTLILIFYFTNLFPFAPSGNFFNNWLSIIYYLPAGFFLFLESKVSRKKNG